MSRSRETSDQRAAPAAVVSALRAQRRLLLTSHANPDGDAIGSELGLARVLAASGRSVTIWNADETPAIYAPLPGASEMHIGSEPPPGYPHDFDAVVALECPSLDRTGLPVAALTTLPLFNIDHHLGNAGYGTWSWVDPEAPAVAELLLHLVRTAEFPVDAESATAFYLALCSDTGGFRYSNSTVRAFTAAAELVRLGASPERASHILWEQRPLASLRLLARAVDTLKLHHDGCVATAVLDDDAFRAAAASKQHTEGLIDQLRTIAGVEAVALFRQIGANRYKISLRSRGATNVEQIAKARGGGGHLNAAGCFGEGPVEPLREQIAKELATALEMAS